VRFDLRSLMSSVPCLTVLAQDLCYSDPLSLVLTFLTHTMAVRILSLVAALPSLCMLCMPLMFRSQQPQKNSHQSTSETQTQTQTHGHADTQTHRHTDTQTHRHTDTQTHRLTDTKTHRREGNHGDPPPPPAVFNVSIRHIDPLPAFLLAHFNFNETLASLFPSQLPPRLKPLLGHNQLSSAFRKWWKGVRDVPLAELGFCIPSDVLGQAAVSTAMFLVSVDNKPQPKSRVRGASTSRSQLERRHGGLGHPVQASRLPEHGTNVVCFKFGSC
jgi:hypothetical protein